MPTNSRGSGGRTSHGCSQQRTCVEARRVQARLGLLRRRRSSRAPRSPRNAGRRDRGWRPPRCRGADGVDVAGAAALGGEAAAGLQRRAHPREKRRRGRGSSGRRRWRTTASTGSGSSSSVRSDDQGLVLRTQHLAHLLRPSRASRRPRSTRPSRQPLDQHRGDAAGAAAGVEHGLVAVRAAAARAPSAAHSSCGTETRW